MPVGRGVETAVGIWSKESRTTHHLSMCRPGSFDQLLRTTSRFLLGGLEGHKIAGDV